MTSSSGGKSDVSTRGDALPAPSTSIQPDAVTPLFRSTGYTQNETDLVIIVTPHLVKPAAPGQQLVSPLDSTLPGNDVDVFLMGQLERKKLTEYLVSGGNIAGPYGHIVGMDRGTINTVAGK